MTGTPRCSVCKVPPGATEGDICAECGELLRWFRSYFADVRNLDPLTITPRTRFVDDLGLDSLDHVDWALEAESVFGIRMSDREAEQMHTVGDFLAWLRAGGAKWLPSQDIEIEKGRWGSRDWKVVTRGGPSAR
jgi:acyl carrier protein